MNFADNLGVCDFFATLRRNVLVVNNMEGLIAFYSLFCLIWAGALAWQRQKFHRHVVCSKLLDTLGACIVGDIQGIDLICDLALW